ncbi:phosphatase PAP2 family protein [uncultured Merdimonas sp.]|uniref:phosphatase PAP2 family protein n=1 Tax=uncultured Merdimonas sp. TaxID=2023269 RepID=UPI00320ABF4D
MKALKNTGKLLKKYSHAWVFLYALIYMPWFTWLEHRTGVRYTMIHSPLDPYIPFVEYFVIPYLLWFLFISVTGLYFFFTEKQTFYRMAAFTITGMTLFLIICTFFPNGQDLRPAVFERDNIFVRMVQIIYATDTPTNVLPSLHVFNSLGAAIAIAHSSRLKKKKAVRIGAWLLTTLIILSTVFLKQHSATDVFAAFAMALVIYPLVYVTQEKKAPGLLKQPT